MTRLFLTALTAAAFSQTSFAADAPAPAEKTTYNDHVAIIFRQRCGTCHNSTDKKGDIALDNYAGVMAGGSGGEIVTGGDLSASTLWNVITHESEPKMPPNADKIPQAELDVIKKWILGGVLEKGDSVAKIKVQKAMAKIEVSNARPATVAMPQTFFGEPLHVSPTTNAVTALTTSPWAPLAAVSGHQQISIWNTATLELLGVLPFPEGQPQILKFSRNGSVLLAGGGRGGASGKVVLFDVATGERQVEVGDEYDVVLAADLSPDQTLIALGGPKKMLRVYSTATGELVHEKKKHTDWITAIEFSPDGVLLASGDRSNGVVVWESHSGQEFYPLNGHQGAITDISWRPDSNVVATASEDGTIRLWEMNNGTQVKSTSSHGGVAAMDYIRDGRMVTTGRDSKVRLWDAEGKQVREFAGMTDLGLEVAFDAETERVLGGDWTGLVRVWSAADGKELGQLSTGPRPAAERLAKVQELIPAAEKAAAETAAALAVVTKPITDREAVAKVKLDEANAVAAKAQEATAAKAAAEKVLAEKTAAVAAAEQALIAARAAYEKAILDKDLASRNTAPAQTAVAQAGEVEKAAAEAAAKVKSEADALAAAAKPNEAEQKALTAAQAAAKSAADLATGLKSQTERLKKVIEGLQKPAEGQQAAN
ncbi:WD domain, G-beta repeat [Caulifigura coniformis]|uniref:WD domain, G-beta repeat n=1 Tax=Caulifigura coniformis TaxID=2527983 RepID=A0A517S840_9PLAN|nr:c-type cytochrome domain-containing protein [Caulifigura coniformis]QDT52295.1 WD domain, G-beta repeat [Caulifigura coniformis]